MAPPIPPGPVVQESSGPSGPVRTFQDLLQNPHDEALFDYYATAQLALVDTRTGRVTPIGPPGIFADAEPSPDGTMVLVERVHRPYSYLYPVSSFPQVIQVWSLAGSVIRTVAKLPLQDKVPIEGVPTGPRSVHWRPTEPHNLVWVEALDDGDPKKKAPHRDRVMSLASVERGVAQEVIKIEHRFAGLRLGR